MSIGWVQVHSRPRIAIEHLSRAAESFRANGNNSSLAYSLLGLGNASTLLSEYRQGVAYFEEMGRVYETTQNRVGQSMALNGIGQIHQRLGQPRKALEYLNAALAMQKEAGGRLLKRNSAVYLVGIGNCHLSLGELLQAKDSYEQARLLAKEDSYTRTEALALVNLGIILTTLGENRQALDYLKDALPKLKSTGDERGAAGALKSVAILHFRMGDLLSFLNCMQQSLTAFQKIGLPGQSANAMCDIGAFYSSIGQGDEAETYYRKALAETESTQSVLDRLSVLCKAGHFYGEIGRLPRERECLDEARELVKRAQTSHDEAQVLLLCVDYYRRTGQIREAREAAETARNLYREAGQKQKEAMVEHELGHLEAKGGRLEVARQHLERHATLMREIGYVQGEADALAELGVMEERKGQLASALQIYARALSMIETPRASLGDLTEAKIGYQSMHVPLHQQYISLLMRLGREKEAFEWTQKAKARVLVELMERGSIEPSHSMTEEDRKREADLKRRQKVVAAQLQSATGELTSLQRKPTTDRDNLQEAKTRVDTVQADQQLLEREWRAFYDRLYASNPRLAQQRAARVIGLDEIPSIVPADTALLEYAYLKFYLAGKEREEIALFVVSQEKGKPRLRSFRIGLSGASLQRLASELREACSGRPDTAEERSYQKVSRRLYDLLIAPAVQSLAGKKRLIICPDGPLWDVPFQALLGPAKLKSPIGTPKSLFLWERYSIVYGYSATGTKSALDVRGRPNRSVPKHPILVFADPSFARDSVKLASEITTRSPGEDDMGGLFSGGGHLGALPHTRLEANAIASAFPGATVRTRDKAQEEVVKQEGNRFQYLHFATHALVNGAAPMLSGVVLSRPPDNSPEDGVFTVRELFGMNLAADMVVFSACETGRGAKRHGEGLIGLTWASFVAGVPAQVVSQWSVDDEATAALMGKFYRELKRGSSKDGALRAAVLSMLRNGKHRHPFYWAPFILVGDWR